MRKYVKGEIDSTAVQTGRISSVISAYIRRLDPPIRWAAVSCWLKIIAIHAEVQAIAVIR